MIYCSNYLNKGETYGTYEGKQEIIPAVYLELYCDTEAELGDGYTVNKEDIVNLPTIYDPKKFYIAPGSLLIILDSKKGCFSNSEEQFIPFN